MIEKISENGVNIRQFKNLSGVSQVSHFISGREGGVSEGEKGPLNLSFNVGDNEENVRENRKRLSTAINITPDKLIFPEQTHSSNIKIVSSPDDAKDLRETDGLITNVQGLCITVMSADCVPVLIYDPVKHIAAAVHAGWRGTVNLIAQKTVLKMQEYFGSRPADLIVGIGPSICKEVYETGPEVVEQFHRAFGKDERILKVSADKEKGFPDLWEANKIQLTNAGLKVESIEVAGLCTYTENNKFFSARHSKGKAGRFAAGIMLL